MGFKEQIQEALEERGLTQADLCRLTGLSSSKVSQVVNGATQDPRLSTIAPIADALDLSLDDLAGIRQCKVEVVNELLRLLTQSFDMLNMEGRVRLLEYACLLADSGMYNRDESVAFANMRSRLDKYVSLYAEETGEFTEYEVRTIHDETGTEYETVSSNGFFTDDDGCDG